MKEHKFVPKVWGTELWIVNNDKYCGKRLFFAKGKSCSLHYHHLKEETFFIQSGELFIRYYDKPEVDELIIGTKPMIYDSIRVYGDILKAGDSFHIPIGRRHQMTGLIDTVMFEFSTHHEDSDSYRIIPS